jgi:hypothetical protein
MTTKDLQDILQAMQMLHERLLRVETWMLNEDKKNEEERENSG